MLHKFYIRCFYSACWKCWGNSNSKYPNISETQRDKIILDALENLSEREKRFITIRFPLYLENDPNGVVNLKCHKELLKTFNMNLTKREKYKNQIRAKIIRNILKSLTQIHKK